LYFTFSCLFIFGVVGVDLANIVIKTIMLLENAGAKVVSLTSDGATTNRTLWK